MWTLITGASKRIGKGIALRLAKEGHNICIHYNVSIGEAKALQYECLALGVQAELIQANFSTINHIHHFIQEYKERFGSMNALINNIGNYAIESIAMTSNEVCLDLFQTNFFLPFMLSREFLPLLKASQGSIINLGVSGLLTSISSQKAPIYFSLKMALLQFTRMFAKEVAKDLVRVNMVSPGYTTTSIDLPKSSLPFGRMAEVDEVAQVVAFLLNEKNSYITGQNIEVAGAVGL